MEESKDIIKVEKLSKDDIETLTQAGIIPKDCLPAMVNLFARFCAESKLSPFKRQVHLVPRAGRYTIQVGIDGYRAIADRTGKYAGNEEAVFEEMNGKPIKATVTVYKLVNGAKCAFTATARWEEYAPQDERMAFMWKKMPFLMLAKCSESQALRKAFPDELSGVYTDEEMQQADVHVGSGVANEEKATPIAEGKKKQFIPSICADCKAEISNPNVVEYSKQFFGVAVCFNCQQLRKNHKEEIEGDYSELHDETI